MRACSRCAFGDGPSSTALLRDATHFDAQGRSAPAHGPRSASRALMHTFITACSTCAPSITSSGVSVPRSRVDHDLARERGAAELDRALDDQRDRLVASLPVTLTSREDHQLAHQARRTLGGVTRDGEEPRDLPPVPAAPRARGSAAIAISALLKLWARPAVTLAQRLHLLRLSELSP